MNTTNHTEHSEIPLSEADLPPEETEANESDLPSLENNHIDNNSVDLEGEVETEGDEQHQTAQEQEDVERKQVIVHEDEPVFNIFSELFFGESDDEIIARVVSEKLPEPTARQIIQGIRDMFSGSGEHLINEDYIEILSMIYPPEELYNLAYDGFQKYTSELHNTKSLGDEDDIIHKKTEEMVFAHFKFPDEFVPPGLHAVQTDTETNSDD